MYSKGLSRDSSAKDITNALRSIRYDQSVEVLVDKLNEAGEKIPSNSQASSIAGYIYTIIFKNFQENFKLPFVKILSADRNPKIFTQIIDPQSQPTSGNYTVSIGEKKIGPFDYNLPWTQLKANLIASFPEYFNDFTDFWGWSEPQKGIGIKIRYRNNKGNIPNLKIGGANLVGGIEGKKPEVYVKTIVEGSFNLFYEPVPADFLFRDSNKKKENFFLCS